MDTQKLQEKKALRAEPSGSMLQMFGGSDFLSTNRNAAQSESELRTKLRHILKTYWGYDSFRPLQEDIAINAVLGKDALALLPTGGGKSICFQVPGMAREGLCLVVSPLIALMKDQVEHLKDKGIAAECVHSALSSGEISLILNRAHKADLKFLYLSPERLQNKECLEYLKSTKLSLIAVDEAHCISQWGYDFRPPYLEIAKIREFFPKVPLLALTATATPDVVQDIINRLKIEGRTVFRKSFVRDNLIYYAVQDEDKLGRMCRSIRKMGGCGIVYVRNRKKTEEIADFLCSQKITATAYHAGLSPEQKNLRQNAWMADRVQIMVATNAFGMGIDKPNVRFVIHIDLPDTIEAYFQEAGRAGRDGKSAIALLIYHQSDVDNLKERFCTSYPSQEYIKQVYTALCNYCNLAEGSGKGYSRDFVLEDFCHEYRLQFSATAAALSFLERDGYIYFPQEISSSAQLKISIDPNSYYNMRVKSVDFSMLLEAIIRQYGGGIFENYVPISEKVLAQRLSCGENLVKEKLQALQKRFVLDYKPLASKPQIVFLRDRISTSFAFLSPEIYKNRKKIAEEKLRAVIDYARPIGMCRSKYLVEYFGENAKLSCGKCDFCLEEARKPYLEKAEYEEIRLKIQDILSYKYMTIREVCDLFAEIDQDKILMFWNEALDRGFLEKSKENPLKYKWISK